MTAIEKRKLTAQEYLAIERAAEFRSEFHDGEMFAMAGTSREHAQIVFNLSITIGTQFKGRECRAFVTDLRLKVPNLYTYPDLVALCDPPQFEDSEFDTLLNPALIIEVLSKSTEAYDRGKKFTWYRELSSLTEYVLISQEEP